MNILFIGGCANSPKNQNTRTMTCKEIASKLDTSPNHISRMMSNLHDKKAGYFVRMKPTKGSREYRYKLSKKGIEWYYKYMQTFLSGYELNYKRDIKRRVHAGVRIEKDVIPNAMVTKLNDTILNYYLGFTKAGREELKAS